MTVLGVLLISDLLATGKGKERDQQRDCHCPICDPEKILRDLRPLLLHREAGTMVPTFRAASISFQVSK
jgi:hypothetical protein